MLFLDWSLLVPCSLSLQSGHHKGTVDKYESGDSDFFFFFFGKHMKIDVVRCCRWVSCEFLRVPRGHVTLWFLECEFWQDGRTCCSKRKEMWHDAEKMCHIGWQVNATVISARWVTFKKKNCNCEGGGGRWVGVCGYTCKCNRVHTNTDVSTAMFTDTLINLLFSHQKDRQYIRATLHEVSEINYG